MVACQFSLLFRYRFMNSKRFGYSASFHGQLVDLQTKMAVWDKCSNLYLCANTVFVYLFVLAEELLEEMNFILKQFWGQPTNFKKHLILSLNWNWWRDYLLLNLLSLLWSLNLILLVYGLLIHHSLHILLLFSLFDHLINLLFGLRKPTGILIIIIDLSLLEQRCGDIWLLLILLRLLLNVLFWLRRGLFLLVWLLLLPHCIWWHLELLLVYHVLVWSNCSLFYFWGLLLILLEILVSISIATRYSICLNTLCCNSWGCNWSILCLSFHHIYWISKVELLMLISLTSKIIWKHDLCKVVWEHLLLRMIILL